MTATNKPPADLRGKTLQELFDTAVAGLASQGFERSMAPGKVEEDYPEEIPEAVCMYRGEKGRRCAIGWLIPDESYDPGFEGQAVRQLVARGHLLTDDGIVGENAWPSPLADLQTCHDHSASSVGVRMSLANFARRHHLILPAVFAT